MCLLMLTAFVTSTLTIAYGTTYGAIAWLIYPIPIALVGVFAWRVVRKRLEAEPESVEDKDFSKYDHALQWYVERVDERKED